MASLDVGEQLRLARLALAGALVIISQIEGAYLGAEGETSAEDIPDLIWQTRQKIGQAGSLIIELDQAQNEGQVDPPDEEQEFDEEE